MTDAAIDLHAHTTASDGSLSPTELVELAVSVGLAALAVTDHDTIDGIPEALEAGERLGLRIIPGVEISSELEGGTLHVLGYGFDPDHPGLNSGLDRLKQAREDRNPRIIAKLNALGIPITMEQVRKRAGGDLVGRPHMARTLLEMGAVSSIQEAFDRFLGSGAAAHEEKFRYGPRESFDMIRHAGGIPVMAHPYQTKRSGEDLRSLVAELTEAGLGGIEVYYSRHSPEQTRAYRALAEEFDLAQTGGTDFHGRTKPDIALGVGTGGLKVPATLLEDLDERLASG